MKIKYLGPPSKDPCIVCGQHKENSLEPRFLYTCCVDHVNETPTNIRKDVK